jgi:hypothetical protein
MNAAVAAVTGLVSGFGGGWVVCWLERYKTRLRKSELLFQKEFEAASEFLWLHRRLLPRYRFPEMVWCEACEDFAFDRALKELEDFLAAHGAALNRKALARLTGAIKQAEAGRSEVSRNTVSSEGIDIAFKVMQELEGVEEELYLAVGQQSSR